MRIYIRLLDEGTEVARPADAEELGHGLFRILPTAEYDPEDEHWEFPPETIVACEKRADDSGAEFLLAVKRK